MPRKKHVDEFKRLVLPKLVASAVSLVVVDSVPDDHDIQRAAEIGLTLLMDKPLLVVQYADTPIPAGLRRAASAVIEHWRPDDAGSEARLEAAIKRFAEDET